MQLLCLFGIALIILPEGNGRVSYTRKDYELLDWLASVQGRGFGDLPQIGPFMRVMEEHGDQLAEKYRLQGAQARHSRCGHLVLVENGDYYMFTITKYMRFCSVLVKARPGYSLNFEPTNVTTNDCNSEYFYIADNKDVEKFLCAQTVLVDNSGMDMVLLQFERKSTTNTSIDLQISSVRNTDRVKRDLTTNLTSFTDSDQVCPALCGKASEFTGARSLVQPNEALPGEYPWMAQVFLIRPSGKLGKYRNQTDYCAGSILDRKHILTAAHCLDNPIRASEVLRVFVVAGLTSRQSVTAGTVWVEADHWTVHPRYNETNHKIRKYDIAIITLEEDLVFSPVVAPICLAPPETYTKRTLSLTAFGHLKNRTISKKLHELMAIVWDSPSCQTVYDLFNPDIKISDHEICLYAPYSGACRVDSGAPAVIKRGDRFYQVGLSSFGFPCEEHLDSASHEGVYTRVPSFVPWILESIGENSYC